MAKVYRKQEHWEAREESEWRIESDALVYRDPAGTERRWPWKEIVGVWAGAAPTHRAGWRYQVRIWTAQGKASACELDNVHVSGVGEREDRIEAMRAFVLDLLNTIRAKSPEAKGHVGDRWSVYGWRLALWGLLAALCISSALRPSNTLAYEALFVASFAGF